MVGKEGWARIHDLESLTLYDRADTDGVSRNGKLHFGIRF